MKTEYDLTKYIEKQALAAGAILVGTTVIRKVEPVIIFAFPFTDRWFFKQFWHNTKAFSHEYLISRHVQNVVSAILRKEGYRADKKDLLSVYGDFRPLAAAAGFGDWGRNGLIVNRDYGSNMLFSAIFTDAPICAKELRSDVQHVLYCRDCGKCIEACPQKAFQNGYFDFNRCFVKSILGCAECLKACCKK